MVCAPLDSIYFLAFYAHACLTVTSSNWKTSDRTRVAFFDKRKRLYPPFYTTVIRVIVSLSVRRKSGAGPSIQFCSLRRPHVINLELTKKTRVFYVSFATLWVMTGLAKVSSYYMTETWSTAPLFISSG